jgi:hypothetical protein
MDAKSNANHDVDSYSYTDPNSYDGRGHPGRSHRDADADPDADRRPGSGSAWERRPAVPARNRCSGADYIRDSHPNAWRSLADAFSDPRAFGDANAAWLGQAHSEPNQRSSAELR